MKYHPANPSGPRRSPQAHCRQRFGHLALSAALALFTFVASSQTRSIPPAPAVSRPSAPAEITPQQIAEAERALNSGIFDPNTYMGALLQASDQGNAAARRDLGLVFLTGTTRKPPDPVLALQWFENASLHRDVRASSYIGDFYLDPKNSARSGKPDLVNARFWYEKAYKAHDARGTLALAVLSCNGTGTHVNLRACGKLLDSATGFGLPSDPPDVTANLKQHDLLLGDAYRTGQGVHHSNKLAASWYAKAAALGSVPAALAESKLYIEPGGLHRDLPKALAILDTITSIALAGKTPTLCEPAQFPGHDSVTQTYLEIGAIYEAHGPRSFPQALAAYNKAAALGNGTSIIAIGLRYANGTGVPRNLDQAQTILMALSKSDSIKLADRHALSDALDSLAAQVSVGTPSDTARITLLRQTSRRGSYIICPSRAMAAPSMAASPPPVERYPNLQAPDTVTTLQTFTVQVSLNTIQFDNNTQVLNGDQDNGRLRFYLPAGMTSMPIDVALIAPGMTFVNGSTNTATLTLDETTSNSTPAVFTVQAPTAPRSTELIATLSYHQTFLAQLARNIAITAAVTASAPAPQPPLTTLTPPTPDTAPTRSDTSPLGPKIGPMQQIGSPAPQPRFLTLTPPQPKPAAAAQPFLPDPTGKLSDLTIIETLVGDSMSYQIIGPGIDPASPVLVPDAAATALKVQSDYAQLQSQAMVLAAGTGTACAADRASKAAKSDKSAANGSDTDPSCSDSVFSRGLIEGIGTDLYLHDSPQSFRDIYQQMLAAHTRLHSITIVTNSPLLPWELLCVPSPTGKGCNFLGLTTAIVRENSAAPQLAQPADIPFSAIDVVAPNYTGALSLAGAAAELKSIQTDFPASKHIDGDANSVALMIKSAPQGIIHFTGHGKRVTGTPAAPPSAATPAATPAAAPAAVLTATPPPDTLLAPHVAIALEDYDMTPDTFVAFRAEGNASAHPFYFFNACDLGQSDKELTYVAGWAPDLMRSGAAGYLGALYEVGDASAASFAAHFYAGLKANLASTAPWTMADLVTQTRQQTYAESNDPTALAYVLYAKPFMTLVPANAAK